MLRRLIIFNHSITSATTAAACICAAATNITSSHHIANAPKPRDHDNKIERLKRASWTWERHNGPLKPHRPYTFDPCSWNRKEAAKIEAEANTGPDKLPLVQRLDMERERQQEVLVNKQQLHQQQRQSHAQQQQEDLASFAPILPRFPSALTSKNNDNEKQKGVAAAATTTTTTQELCADLTATAWDLLRQLLRPSALRMNRHAKQTLLSDLSENAALLRDALSLVLREESENVKTDEELVSHATLALHFAGKATDKEEGNTVSAVARRILEDPFACYNGGNDDNATAFRTCVIFATVSLTASENEITMIQPLAVAHFLLDERNAIFLSSIECIDVVALCLANLVPQLDSSYNTNNNTDDQEKIQALTNRLLVAFQFAVSRFMTRVLARHDAIQRKMPDKGFGGTPVDAVTLKWIVNAIGAFAAAAATTTAAGNVSFRRTVDALDSILTVTPNPDLPLVALIHAAVNEQQQQQADDTALLLLPLLCAGVARRVPLQHLQLLSVEDTVKMLSVVADSSVLERAAILFSEAEEEKQQQEQQVAFSSLSFQNTFDRGHFGKLATALVTSVLSNCEAEAFKAQHGAALLQEAVLNIADIAVAYPLLKIDVSLWKNTLRVLLLASERQQDQSSPLQSAMLSLREKHCVDSHRKQLLAVTARELELLSKL